MLEREETAVKSTMDNLGAIMGGERALKLKKKKWEFEVCPKQKQETNKHPQTTNNNNKVKNQPV